MEQKKISKSTIFGIVKGYVAVGDNPAAATTFNDNGRWMQLVSICFLKSLRS